MSLLIPTRGDVSFYDLQVTLEDVTYTLEFRWNVRLGAWFMNILDGEGVTMLVAGVRLVASWPLAAYTARHIPPGAFFVLDTTGRGEDPTLEGFGTRWLFVYFESTEIGL